MLVEAIQCMFRLKSSRRDGSGEEGPAKKPMGFLTNSWALAEELNKKCRGEHKHAWLDAGRSSKVAVYPDGVCEAFCVGIRRQIQVDRTSGLQVLYLTSDELCGVVNGEGEIQRVSVLESVDLQYSITQGPERKGSERRLPAHVAEVCYRGRRRSWPKDRCEIETSYVE